MDPIFNGANTINGVTIFNGNVTINASQVVNESPGSKWFNKYQWIPNFQ